MKKMFTFVAMLLGMSAIAMADPTVAPAAPTYPANQVKAVYSATYSADCNFGEWGSGTTLTQTEFGKKYVTTQLGYFGLEFTGLNCSKMESFHADVWSDADMSMRFVPIHGGAEVGVVKQIKGGEWNAIDIALSEFAGVTNWTNVFQIKIDNAGNQTFWLNNIYFYTTKAPDADTEAPKDFTASLVSASYFSATVKAQATDNSGVVIFQVMNGETKIADKTAVSGTETTFTVAGLMANTEYNLTIVATDEAGNKAAETVALTVKTLAAPAAAPAPAQPAADVLSVYSDAYPVAEGVGRYMGGWGQSTVETEGELAAGDKALLYTTCNYLGWEGVKVDATNYTQMHLDIYVEAAGTIKFTPIWGGEALKTINLVAGWNAIDLDLVKDFAGINLANIYQLKWADMPATCWMDNIYFYKGVESALSNTTMAEQAQKMMVNGQLVIIRNGVRYSAQGQVIE